MTHLSHCYTILSHAVAPRRALTVSQWADDHRILSGKQASERGRWRQGRGCDMGIFEVVGLICCVSNNKGEGQWTSELLKLWLKPQDFRGLLQRTWPTNCTGLLKQWPLESVLLARICAIGESMVSRKIRLNCAQKTSGLGQASHRSVAGSVLSRLALQSASAGSFA